MAWNEPGGGGKKDPWGGDRERDPWGGRDKGKEQGPPDLDEIVGKLRGKFGGLFGRKGGGGGGAGRAAGPGAGSLLGMVLVAVVGWTVYDIAYIIEPAQRGVVLRFGRYVATLQPGLNIRLPRPIEQVFKVNIDEVRNIEMGYRSSGGGRSGVSVPSEALMLTQDENIIDIKFAVQYKVKDARDYLFRVRDPDLTLGQVTESAVREIIGKSKMDFALTEGRSVIVDRAELLIQEILDRYGTGLEIVSVNMQDAQPPEEVQDAFADAVKAREDEQRLKNEAEAYSNDIIPRARGAAARQLAEAEGYKSRVVAQAEGETSRFLQVLAEYEKAPAVTRERLYIESMESVLSEATKVMVDIKKGSNLLYLPLDRILGRASPAAGAQEPAAVAGDAAPARQDDSLRLRNNVRERRTR